MKQRAARLLTLVASLLIAACGQTTTTIGPVPDPALIIEGGALFASNCAQCHGPDLRGTESGPSFFSEVYEPGHHGDGAFLVAVQSGSPQHHWGFGPMPPVDGLTSAEVEAIVAFVRQRQAEEGFEPYPP